MPANATAPIDHSTISTGARRFFLPALAATLLILTVTFAHAQTKAAQPSLDQAYNKAQQTLAAGDLKGAQQQFEAITRAHPNIAEIHATLGALLFQQGDFRSALRELNKAKQLKPTLPKLDGLIAMTQAELGQHRDALAALEQNFHAAEDPAVKRVAGLELERAYSSTGQDAKSVAVALELQQLYPSDPEVLYNNERIFGNFAYLTVQSLIKAAPESVWRFKAQAEAQESQGAHDAAIASYRKVLSLDPGHPGTHYRIGRCLRERARDSHHPEDLEAARAEFKAELQLDPDNANAHYEIGELDRIAGKLPEARASFEKALSSHPDFPEANLGFGTVLASLHEPEAALPYLQKATQEDPGDEAAWYRLSQVERALGHKTEQQAALKQFLALHEATPSSLQAAPARDVTPQIVEPESQQP
jgi:predicted Zn-dependent protease